MGNPLASVNLRDLIAQRTAPASDARIATQQPVKPDPDALQSEMQRIHGLANQYSQVHPHAAFGSTVDTLNGFVPQPPPTASATNQPQPDASVAPSGQPGASAATPNPAPTSWPTQDQLQQLVDGHRQAAFESNGARRRTTSDFRRKDLDTAIGKHENMADLIDSFRNRLQQHQQQQIPIDPNRPTSPIAGAPVFFGTENQ